MTITLEELIQYMQGELAPDREGEVEELVFEDTQAARRLDAVVRLGQTLRALVRDGRLQSTLTTRTVESLARAGLTLRTYVVNPGETVPCTIAGEDLVVIRLRGGFDEAERVDVRMEGTFGGVPAPVERYEDVAVDRAAGEIVLVYPGDRIRSLPRSQFRYLVTSGERSMGEYGLDHTPGARSAGHRG